MNMHRSLWQIFCVFFLAVFFSSAAPSICLSADKADLSFEQLVSLYSFNGAVNIFDKFVFVDQPASNFGKVVTKWEKPVSYYVFPPGSDMETDVERFFANLVKVTGLNINRVERPREANLFILFPGDKARWDKFITMAGMERDVRPRECVCNLSRAIDPPNSIYSATLLAPAYPLKLARQMCLRQAMSTCLGVNRGSKLSKIRTPATQEELSQLYELKEIEKFVLMAIYNESIVDQMPRDQFYAELKKLAPSWMETEAQ